MNSFRSKREMLLDDHPSAFPFFEYPGPAGVLPVCRLTFPFVNVIQHAEPPGGITGLRDCNLKIPDFIPYRLEVKAHPEFF